MNYTDPAFSIVDEIKRSPRTGGELFLQTLQNLNVKYIFGTTGGGMPDLQDAMTETKPPIWIQGLHEFPTVCAAAGYALASEDISVCLIDRVVGVSNSLGAFYASYANYAPIVIFASQNLPGMLSGTREDGRPRVASHYNSWQNILPTPWTKWRCDLTTLDLLPQSVMKAFAISKAEPRGPTYMTLRQDLMASQVNPTLGKSKRTDFFTSSAAADEQSVDAAARVLVGAESPILVATNMGRSFSAVPRLVELAEALGCGVLDGRNFLNFPMSHPLFLGFTRKQDQPSYQKEADVLLGVETYYEYPMAPSQDSDKTIFVGPDAAMLQGSNGGDYGGNYYPARRLIGSSALVLAQLTKAVQRMTSAQRNGFAKERRENTIALHQKMTSAWEKEAEKHFDEDPISPHRVAFELNKLWDEDTIWVNETITAYPQLVKGVHLTKPGTYFSNPSSHLGAVASMAYGVALARPAEKVVAMMGDGAFVFGNPASALWTCSHYHIPVLYLIFNNACWGCEWPFIVDTTLKLASTHKDYEYVDLDEPRIDFAKLAEAHKVRSATLSHPEDAEEKLRWAFDVVSKGEPALVDVHLKKYTEGKSSYNYSFMRPEKNKA